MSTSNDILVGYSPSDFFYTKAEVEGKMPTAEQCDALNPSNIEWNDKCNSDNFANNATDCFNKELCKNRNSVEWLRQEKNINSGSTQKYLDMNKEYNYQLLTSFNLGVGIMILTGFIIKNTYYNI
jgi:hypothetical protein